MPTSPVTESFPLPHDSHIRFVTYNPVHETLTVQFKTAPGPYIHTRVPRELFDSWKQWTEGGYSPGKFYHSHVKRYPLKAIP